jgi:hypothetical protein
MPQAIETHDRLAGATPGLQPLSDGGHSLLDCFLDLPADLMDQQLKANAL